MHTKLTYENHSLNPHIGRLGLFWDVEKLVPGTRPLLWKAIEKCRYGWHHPISIEWQAGFLILDSCGNQRQLTAGSYSSETGTRILGPFGCELNSQITLIQERPRPDLSFAICRNGQPLAKFPLGMVGSWSLTMPDQLKMQIECRAKVAQPITDPEATVFSLNGMRSFNIALCGGAPGPCSTPLRLVSYGAIAT